MKKFKQKCLIKFVNTKNKLKARLSGNSGQGSVETAIICEPFYAQERSDFYEE